MNRDLEETLEELGPDCRAVVVRLRRSREVEPKVAGASKGTRGWLIAASLLTAITLAFPCLSRRSRPAHPSVRLPPREYRASAAEMIATQNPDGSWQNDFLTRRNLAALARLDDPQARLACKKASRNLRLRGLR